MIQTKICCGGYYGREKGRWPARGGLSFKKIPEPIISDCYLAGTKTAANNYAVAAENTSGESVLNTEAPAAPSLNPLSGAVRAEDAAGQNTENSSRYF